MSSVPVVNPGVSDLLQTLTKVHSQVMSSPTVVTALKTAPAADVVQLSMAANQLEHIDAMFGISTSATDEMGNSVLAQLESSAVTPSSELSHSAPSDRATAAEIALQSEVVQGLFGPPQTGPGTLFSTLG